MPHISKIGRRSLGARLTFALMYLLLGIGGITMIVPFMIWLSNSFKSNVDSQTLDLIPAYWYQQDMLAKKYFEQQTNYDLNYFNALARSNVSKLINTTVPAPAAASEATDYRDYLKSLPESYTTLVDRGPWSINPLTYGTHPAVLDYRKVVLGKYGSLAAIEKKYSMTLGSVEQLNPPAENWFARSYQPEIDVRLADFLDFKGRQPLERLVPVPAESIWNTYLRTKVNADVAAVNAELGTNYATVDSAEMPPRVPQGNAKLAAAWGECLRNDIPIWYIRADETAWPAWQRFLAARYQDTISLYTGAHKVFSTASYQRFADIPLPRETPPRGDMVTIGEWNDFVGTSAPLGSLYLDTPETRYRQYLQHKYATVEAVNKAYGTQYARWAQLFPPALRVMAAYCRTHAGNIRGQFILRNYQAVWSYMALHGHAFLNTIVLIVLSLLFTLTINPITAYALSRFKLKSTNKLLLFLLATMAFPAEIAMIPNFLLLRDLHLLNTFWALVLPGMANGFSIFLLKGMFDGLPQDLYEAAELDGASEAVIFWRITMPLVRPFLAYLSLGTFIGAYGAFVFAFLLCPQEKMWTLMVYLQQMDWASQPVQFAAFVLASIPTLIVFVTCQRIIMEGIILPTEK